MNIGERNWKKFAEMKDDAICNFAFTDETAYFYIGKKSGEIDRVCVCLSEENYDDVKQLLSLFRFVKWLVVPSIFFLLGFLMYKFLIV